MTEIFEARPAKPFELIGPRTDLDPRKTDKLCVVLVSEAMRHYGEFALALEEAVGQEMSLGEVPRHPLFREALQDGIIPPIFPYFADNGDPMLAVAYDPFFGGEGAGDIFSIAHIPMLDSQRDGMARMEIWHAEAVLDEALAPFRQESALAVA